MVPVNLCAVVTLSPPCVMYAIAHVAGPSDGSTGEQFCVHCGRRLSSVHWRTAQLPGVLFIFPPRVTVYEILGRLTVMAPLSITLNLCNAR